MPDNPLVAEATANEVLDNLGMFVTNLHESVDVGYFFGMAFDSVNPHIDRNRFANAIQHLLKEEGGREIHKPKLLVCIDPNLTHANIDTLFRKVNEIRDILETEKPLRRIDAIPLLGVEQVNEEPPHQVFNTEVLNVIQPGLNNHNNVEGVQPFYFTGGRGATAQSGNAGEYNTSTRRNNGPNEPVSAATPQHLHVSHPTGTNPFFYKFTFEFRTGTPDVFSSIFYVYFLRYGLTTTRTPRTNGFRNSNYIGKHLENQFNIQGIDPNRRFTIQHYVDSCVYDDESFYAHLERLGTHDSIGNVYFASAMSSHSTFMTIVRNGNTYASVIPNRLHPDQGVLRGTLTNRYFEDFCEILRVMRQIQNAGKNVFFITLDPHFRVFNHPTVQRIEDVPYQVPFQNSTKFFINDPKFFRKVIMPRATDPRGTPIRILDGGKRKSRKQRRKAKKTRKHRV
jgi:hypothetical protein